MKKRIRFQYVADGVSKVSGAVENEDYALEMQESENRLTIRLIPKKTLELSAFCVKMFYEFTGDDRFFAGGYQSWSTTREYGRDDIQRPSTHLASVTPLTSHLAKLSSDEYMVSYTEQPGEFHSHCYTYIRNGERVRLFGSLSEKTAFTVFQVKMREDSLAVCKDVAGMCLGEPVTLLDMVFFEGGYDEVFDRYFAMMNMPETRTGTMSGYTSWYNYFQKIDEQIILRDLDGLDRVREQTSIFQIDDGYEPFVGDWLDINRKKFPHGMRYIAEKIHAKGYLAGIWLAPFNCQRSSHLAKEHPDWLIRDEKGRPVLGCMGWGGAYTLDIAHPQAREYIRHVFDVVLNAWGYDMVKLDFLYSQCIFPRGGKSRGQIMGEAMAFLRECVGDKLLLGCGVPIGSAIGVVDACRISCDVDLAYEGKFYNRLKVSNEIPSAQNAINNTLFRRHLNGRAFMNDPDVFFLRNQNLTFTREQKLLLAKINNLCGNVLFVSDNAGEFDEEQTALLKKFFTKNNAAVLSAQREEEDVLSVCYAENGKTETLTFRLSTGEILNGTL